MYLLVVNIFVETLPFFISNIGTHCVQCQSIMYMWVPTQEVSYFFFSCHEFFVIICTVPIHTDLFSNFLTTSCQDDSDCAVVCNSCSRNRGPPSPHTQPLQGVRVRYIKIIRTRRVQK